MKLRSTVGLSFVSLLALAAACSTGDPSSQSGNVEEVTGGQCKPTRIMLVVDASASMTEEIAVAGTPTGEEGEEPTMSTTTKWEALATSVHDVLKMHRSSAQFGLMPFPGSSGGCAAGEVTVEMDVNTAVAIDDAIAATNIQDGAATPAGQTLMAAAKYEKLIDPAYENYVVFISDGWQYCSLSSEAGAPSCASAEDSALMGIEGAPSCNACASNDSEECATANVDGCYCVRSWPVLGVEALKAAGVTTYVVGFGDKVDAQTLNRAAAAGGDPLPDCVADSTEASCYLKAESAGDLSTVLSKIVNRLTKEECPGACNLAGERTCTLQGWSECVVPSSIPCSVDCGIEGVLEGTQQCSNDTMTECSAECSSSEGEGGDPQSGTGGAGGEPSDGGGGTEVVDPNPDPDVEDGEDPWADDAEDEYEDPYYDEDDYDDYYEDEPASEGPSGNNEADGGCNVGASSRGDASWLALLLGLVALRRRRS